MTVDLTKIDRPFGLLHPETQEALHKWEHGWEMYSNTGNWLLCQSLSPALHVTYRARPDPLMPDTIDWSHVAPEWKWMARDDGREALFYSEKPYNDNRCWNTNGDVMYGVDLFASYRRGTVAWQDSLVKRPE